MIPALSLAAAVLLACQCHRARQREQHWREEARLSELAVDAAEAAREALAIGLLAESFQELGALEYFVSEEWDR